MKILQRIFAFSVSLILGLFLTIPFLDKTEVKPPVKSEIEIDVVNLKNLENDVAAKEIKEEPEIYDLEGFWEKTNTKFNKNLLETGEFSNVEDFKVKSGDVWLAMSKINNEFVLRPQKIKISSVKVYESYWKNISVNSRNKPLFLTKGLKNIKAGKILTLFKGNTWNEANDEKPLTSLEKNFRKIFRLGKSEYTLQVKEGISKEGKPLLVLLLEDGKTSQIIHMVYDLPEEENYVGNLFWVGDLDNDGKLDFYMDFNNYGKGGFKSGLFLSSEAEKGKLVKEFNYFILGGC